MVGVWVPFTPYVRVTIGPPAEVSAHSVNTTAMTAQNVWNFNDGRTIYSSVCGSSYELGDSYLVDFATADNG
ncbi:MAG: aryl-sulfate sulfotransferase [Acidobacteriota bacterium]|nr:aryl-sulfate sulfotransferase [Acidobacteriota bacterium]